MDEITISKDFFASVELTAEEVDLINLCGKTHYDGVCREFAISNWPAIFATTTGRDFKIVRLQSHALGIMMKCLEQAPGPHFSKTLTKERFALAKKLRTAFNALQKAYREENL